MKKNYFEQRLRRCLAKKIRSSLKYQKISFFTTSILPHYQKIVFKALYKNVLTSVLLLSFLFFGVKCTAFQSVSKPNNTSTIETASNTTSKKTAQLRKDIIQFAKKYKGSTYTYGGTTPKGFDCSGFTLFVFNEFGIHLPHNSGDQSTKGKKIAIQKAIAGDLLFFSNKGNINHVGLVVSNDKDGLYMIHGSSSRGIVIDNVTTSSYWQPRLQSARNVLD